MIKMPSCAGLFSAVAIGAAMLTTSSSAQELPRSPIEATTSEGEKVLLHPNGRWEYVDVEKAAQAKSLAERYPENAVRPQTAQGGLLGIGRTVMPGDRDYNRGSLNPKLK